MLLLNPCFNRNSIKAWIIESTDLKMLFQCRFINKFKILYAELSLAGVLGVSTPGIWEFCQPYSNQRGQIMPTTLLLVPPDSKT